MSSLDRAFFRAYAKEQPVEVPAEKASTAVAEGASPYVYFQSPRKPQLRYRIEPTHTPWGQGSGSPHVDVAPSQAPYEVDDYQLAEPADEAVSSPAWSHEGEARLVAPAEIAPACEVDVELPAASVIAPAPAIVPAPAIEAKLPAAATPTLWPAAEIDPVAQGIVCLPGMAMVESNYLAEFVAIEPVRSEPQPIAPPPPVVEHPEVKAPVAEATQLGSATPPETAELTFALEPFPPAEAVEPAAAEDVASEQATEPAAESAANPSSVLADHTAAFWEVDRYLYPAVSDRLLSRYEYFTHAGDKLKQAAAAGLKVLGITGVGRDEGRSTLSICLARAAARSGLKVVLIDCDFERPQLAQQIGLDVTSGWQSVARGELSLAEVAIRSLEDGILLLPLTDDPQTNSLSLSDQRVASILAKARAMYDVVILDVGPLDAARHADSSAVPQVSPLDAAIVVWDRRRRKLDEAQAVGQALSNAGVEAVGIAENFAG